MGLFIERDHARGAIIDETALAAVAQERPDLRLALDTFTVEPLPAESPLRDLPQTILTPHMVGHTREVQAGGVGVVIESLRRVLAGELPRYVRNPEVIARWTSRWGTPREGSVTA
jgi:phosphoglycerate dehydrogenase-like enzyme